MTYKNDKNNFKHNEQQPVAPESIPTRSADERVKDALSHVRDALKQPSEISALLSIDPEYRRGRELAIAYLSYRPRSSGKVRDKLVTRDIERTMADDIIRGLLKDGYIDDKKVALALLRERRGRKAEGYRIALQRLIAGGVPKWVAVEVIDQTREEMPEIKLLAAYLKSKFRKDLLYLRDGNPSFEDTKALQQKLVKAAEQRGFLYSDAQKLLDAWF